MKSQTPLQILTKLDTPINIYLILAIIEGIASIVSLLSIPSDPKTATTLGYSTQRLILLIGMLFLLLLFIGLMFKSIRTQGWRNKVANKLFQDKLLIPHILLAITLFSMLLISWIAIYRPEILHAINKSYLLRLTPLVAWLALLIAQLIVVWLLVWRPRNIHFRIKNWDVIAALILFFISFISRSSMTGYGLPYQTVWDEVVTYPQAMRMLTVPGLKPDSNVPGYGKAAYGDLLVYITAFGEVLGFVNGLRTQQVASIDDFVSPPLGVNSIIGAVHPSGIPIQYPRLILAFINSFAPVAIYLILRKIFKADLWSSFGGGFIYAFLSREVLYYSSYILPDALATTLFLFLLFSIFITLKDGSGKLSLYVANGFLVGMIISVSIRSSTVIILPFLALAFSTHRERIVQRLFAIAFGILFGFALTSPYAILDLPGYLGKINSFSWAHDLSWSNRLSGLIFFVQGMFKSGFVSHYVDSMTGSVGLGILTGLLAIIGLWRLFKCFPRQTIIVIIFSALHMYSILPIAQRYTRHALILYPLACISAGVGLTFLADKLKSLRNKLVSTSIPLTHKIIRMQFHLLGKFSPLIVLFIFGILSFRQARLTVSYLQRVMQFITPQVQIAEFLVVILEPEDKVGILNHLPWIEEDLFLRGINFERINLTDSTNDLTARGFTYLVGTDRIAGIYSTAVNTIWDKDYFSEKKVAEFGSIPLQYEGYPSGQLYMFITRISEP